MTIVMVNYRGCDDTIECLESLLRLQSQHFNAIVCDNFSEDASIERLSSWAARPEGAPPTGGPWPALPVARVRSEISWSVRTCQERNDSVADSPFLTILDMGRNAGFAGANNAATRLALLDPDIDYVWYLNNDTVVHPNSLQALLRRFEDDPRIGQCGATIASYVEPERIQALGGSAYRWITGRGRHVGMGLDLDALPAICEVERDMAYVSGASLLVNRRLLEEVGLMVEDYFLYFEEADLAARSKRSFKLAWAPQAIVWHKEGASIGSKSLGRPSDSSIYYLARNALLFTWRKRPLFLFGVVSRLILDAVRFAKKGDYRAVEMTLLGLVDFVTMRTGRRELA